MREKYLLGEIFPVKFLVHSTSGDPFRVLSADWELVVIRQQGEQWRMRYYDG